MVETRSARRNRSSSPINNQPNNKTPASNKPEVTIMNVANPVNQAQPVVPSSQAQAIPNSNDNTNNPNNVPFLAPAVQIPNVMNQPMAEEYMRRVIQYAQTLGPIGNVDRQVNFRFPQQNENVPSREMINEQSHYRIMQSHKRKALDSLAPLVDNVLLRIVEKLFKNRNLNDDELDRITSDKYDDDYYRSPVIHSRKRRSRFSSYGNR